MQCKKALVWSLLNRTYHECLGEEEKTISSMMPLISALFPGINYYSITGFAQVMRDLVMPTLRKRFSELLGIAEEAIDPEETVEIAEMLPSNGYEWQDSPQWRARFASLLTECLAR